MPHRMMPKPVPLQASDFFRWDIIATIDAPSHSELQASDFFRWDIIRGDALRLVNKLQASDFFRWDIIHTRFPVDFFGNQQHFDA